MQDVWQGTSRYSDQESDAPGPDDEHEMDDFIIPDNNPEVVDEAGYDEENGSDADEEEARATDGRESSPDKGGSADEEEEEPEAVATGEEHDENEEEESEEEVQVVHPRRNSHTVSQ